jgi:four helix bundle protein
MNERMFKDRTKGFALSVIRFVDGLPRGRSAEILGRQLLRSATSVGANYRAACRGRSRADVVAKLSLVEEEADESMYWMELLAEGGFTPHGEVSALMAEANELVAMIVASIKTLRTRR